MSRPDQKSGVHADLKERVRAFWQEHPCGTKFSDAAMGTSEFFERVEVHRYGKEWHIPEAADFAGVAVFLASRASDYVTGQTLYVDGGFSAT